MSHRIIAAGHSDVGRQRQANEDAFRLVNTHRLWILADGMGGHAAGQIASQIAVDEIAQFIAHSINHPQFRWPFEQNLNQSFEENALMNAVRVANVRIYNRSLKDPKCLGMGTTVVVAMISAHHELVIASVGDSRCYRYRRGSLNQLTVDHSLLNHLIYNLKLSPEEAREKAGSNVIVKAVGLEDDVEVDLIGSTLYDGDLFLMCSDGLSDLVDDRVIAETIQQYPNRLDQMVHRLIELANQGGGTDNITVIAFQVHEEENTPSLADFMN